MVRGRASMIRLASQPVTGSPPAWARARARSSVRRDSAPTGASAASLSPQRSPRSRRARASIQVIRPAVSQASRSSRLIASNWASNRTSGPVERGGVTRAP
jgi:hypothetical protein